MHDYTKNLIRGLLEKGINSQDENGKTPLILAAWISDTSLVKSFLAKGADVNIEDNLGANVLHYAVRQKDLAVLELIATSGIPLDKKETNGYQQSAIFTPAEVGNIPVLNCLLAAGADPNVTDKYKMTALQWAAQQGKTESVRLLLKYGAEPNNKNNKGITPLISACLTSGKTESVELLLNSGAHLNEQTRTGETALYYAAYYGHPEIVQLLLERGADPSIVNKKGYTARAVAEKNKKNAVVNVLNSWEIIS